MVHYPSAGGIHPKWGIFPLSKHTAGMQFPFFSFSLIFLNPQFNYIPFKGLSASVMYSYLQVLPLWTASSLRSPHQIPVDHNQRSVNLVG